MTGRTAIQLALDTRDLPSALRAARAAEAFIDVVEAGTVLCLAEGLSAVESLRATFPDKPLVADIRIARAGGKFARMAFSAGADRVTVVGESGLGVVEGALAAAAEAGGEVEVELGPGWTEDDVLSWVAAGARHVIAHRSGSASLREDTAIGATLERLLAIDLGQARVTLAGGLSIGDLADLTIVGFDTVAVGSAIVGADDPTSAAAQIRQALDAAEERMRVA